MVKIGCIRFHLASIAKGQRRKVDLQALVSSIIVSTWASPTTLDETTQSLTNRGYKIPVQQSGLSRYTALLP